MNTRITVYDLRCDYKRNPLGTDESRPRFSWKLQASERNVVQSAYQLQVAVDEKFTELVWDTGRVVTDQSVHREYSGPALASLTRYYYRVRVWDMREQEQSTRWSEPGLWETAFLHPDEWSSQWITSSLPRREEEDEPCDYMRKAFALKGPLASARIYATANGLYRLFVNGQPADDTLFAPGWTSYNHRLQYQTYDVTRLLHDNGENALGVILGNGWYKGNLGWSGRRDIYGSKRALLLELHVTYASGEKEVIITDDSWQVNTGPLLMSEFYHGELYDARLAQDAWHQPNYQAVHWPLAAPIEQSKQHLVAQENEPTRIVEELTPKEVIMTPRQETVLDMGQNMVGWVRFTVAAEAGTVIRLQHAEVLDREGNFYTGNLRKAKQTVTYVCRGGGEETYEPYFSFQGFRYVKVEGVPAEAINLAHFTGCVIHSDLEQTGTFECSDELVNRLQHNILWGQKGNFLDVPTDCPQRDERLGWTGDAQVFIRTSSHLMNVAPFFRKWLKDLAADQRQDGGVPFVIPDVLDEKSHSSAAWGDAAVICPWVLYEVYGDQRILEEQYDSMKAWVEYMRSQGQQEHLWNTGFHFGDWLALDAKENSYIGSTPKDLIATAFYAYSSQLLAKAASILGREQEAEQYRQLHLQVAEQFRQEFVTPNGRVAAPTQTAYTLALMFDLLEEKDRPRAAGILASYIEENDYKLTTGFVGTPYLCPVLSRFGYVDLAYRLVLQQEYPSWLYSVLKGATTIWEHWDGIKPDGSFWSDDMNSYNHYAYGSIGEWLYRVAAGLDTDESRPGYQRSRIEPHYGKQLTSAAASYQSLYGKHEVSWEKGEASRITLTVIVPPNTDALLQLPGAAPGGLIESGEPVEQADGIRKLTPNESGLLLELGSGTYRFEYTYTC